MIRTAIVADVKNQQEAKVRMVYHQSGQRYVPHTWELTFPGANKTAHWTIDDSWGVSVQIKGLENAIQFAKNVMGAEDDTDAAVCIIVLFVLNRNLYDWSKRHHCLFPTDLAFTNDGEVDRQKSTSWCNLPKWYLDCARAWMHMK